MNFRVLMGDEYILALITRRSNYTATRPTTNWPNAIASCADKYKAK